MSIIDDPRIRLISTDDDSVQPKEMINYATTPAAVDYRIRQTTQTKGFYNKNNIKSKARHNNDEDFM